MKMRCQNCNHELLEGNKFCPECGQSTGIPGQSGLEEGGLSFGAINTMAASPSGREAGDDISVNSLRTMVGVESGKDVQAGNTDSTVLAERYELLAEVGRGGFARVWKARDLKLGRTVAVKRLLTEAQQGAAGEQTLARFRREAQAIAQLNHRNIVGVFDHDRDSEGDYIVMEFVEGGTLTQYLKEKGGKLPVPEAVALVQGIAQGLAYAHRKNLVHRDIKPGNILLQSEAGELIPKIVDFGLARVGTESELSLSGYGMGTPWYMPPEQRRDAKSVNHTADIYALGKVLFELVSGEVPDNVDPEKLPPALAQIVLRCIKSNPAERYFSADDLFKDLTSITNADHSISSNQTENSKNYICQSCGTINDELERYCGNCGIGFTRRCPECEHENTVNKQFCGKCGTEIDPFLKWKDVLAKIHKYAAEKRWSRAIKEYELLSGDQPQFPGNKGRRMASEVLKYREMAEASEKKLQEFRNNVGGKISKINLPTTAGLAAEFIKIAPLDDPSINYAKEIVRVDQLIRSIDLAFSKREIATVRTLLEELKNISNLSESVLAYATLIETDIAKLELLRAAREYLDAGEVNSLHETLEKLKESGEDQSEISKLVSDSQTYRSLMDNAQTFSEKKDFSNAKRIILEALELAPNSKETIEFLKEIKHEQRLQIWRRVKFGFKSCLGTIAIIVIVIIIVATLLVQTGKRKDRKALVEEFNRKVTNAYEAKDKNNWFVCLEQAESAQRISYRSDLERMINEARRHVFSDFTNSFDLTMKWIPAGRFMMGSTAEERTWAVGSEGQGVADYFTNECDPTEVRIHSGFWMGETTVSRRLFRRFVASRAYRTEAEKAGKAVAWSDKDGWIERAGTSWHNPGFDQRGDHPVVCVTWNDAVEFCNWLTRAERESGHLSYS